MEEMELTLLLTTFVFNTMIGPCLSILIQKSRVRLTDLIYFSLLGVVSSIIFATNVLFGVPRSILLLITNMVMVLGYTYFLHVKKYYTIKEALILILPVLMIVATVDATVVLLATSIGLIADNFVLAIGSLLVQASMMVSLTLLFTHFSKAWRVKIKQALELQVTIVGISALMFITYHALLFLLTPTTLDFNIVVIFFLAQTIMYTIAAVVFGIYANFIKMRYQIQIEEQEHKALKYYTIGIEQQYAEIRKFKHDYQNILASMDSYFKEKDYASLETYYYEKVKKVSDQLLGNQLGLEDLSQIKVSEIKSILTTKLVVAKTMGLAVTFEAPTPIESLPINSIDFVRMSGIILDNAVEALVEQDGGACQVGLLKRGNELLFVVQNTCQTEIPKLHLLKQEGFSTKGDGRGLGLSNLSEIIHKYKNVHLETIIDQNQFVQKIMIHGLG